MKKQKEKKQIGIGILLKRKKWNYYYTFKKNGKYVIKYKFKKLLNSTNFMFNDCESLSSLDLSNFKAQNITNISYMLYGCKSYHYHH